MLLLPILQFPFSDIFFPFQTCATRGGQRRRRRRRKRRARAAAILIDCGACGQRADQDQRRARRRGSRWTTGATTTTNGDGMVRFPLPFFPSTKVGGKEGKATPRLPDRGREGERGAKEGRTTDCLAMCVHSRGHPMMQG